ncbi:MAG: hypothetical protein PF638_02985 [Candidatus Delongbacteria bacterium]|jgi:hypothetical protein|nr:hypothetical protein [Candidatus Delongbacteria bacterium]
MKKIIIIGILLVVIVLLLLLTISDNKSSLNKVTYENILHQDTLNVNNIKSIEQLGKSIFFEDFSSKNISDWNIDYQNATNWIYEFTDSDGIIIKHIINESFSKNLYGPWANVIMKKTIPIKVSIIFISKISWDSFNSITAMQHIYFSFLDADDNEMFFFGYNDPYISYQGGILTKFHDKDYYWHKKRELDFNDNCLLKMVKKGKNIQLYYNDEFIVQSTVENDINKINVVCGYFASINYKDSNLKSTFGLLGIDFINISTHDDLLN